MVFCEVKFRTGGFEEALHAVDGRKRETLRRAVRAYRTREDLWGVPARGDIVCVSRDGIDVVRSAFPVS